DQLYLLPFLRRYASFVGMEQEEVASRFIRDVQRADMNPGRISEPMVMIADRKSFPWNTVLLAAGGALAVIALVWLGYRHISNSKTAATSTSAPVATQPQPAPAPVKVSVDEAPKAVPVASPPAEASGSANEKAPVTPPHVLSAPAAAVPVSPKANRPKTASKTH
ncbi:MAG TPA: hypothetical protein VKR29_06275, partial [Candidatus Binataceae bacterium]|nr:hypothetical protein [Candidatus Binataceae bacterium]